MGSEPAPSALTALTELLGLRPAAPEGDGATLGLIGPPDRPRFLLPLGHPQATRAACVAYNRLRPLRARANRLVMAVASSIEVVGHRVITERYAPDTGPGSLLGTLADLLGEAEVQVAVGVANHDAVWKPTLQCFTPDGQPLAYVKVGLGPVGSHLVSTEGATLAAWADADDPRIVVPDLLATRVWRGIPIVCTAPMPPDVTRLPVGPVSPWPVRLLDPPLPDAPLGGTPWWSGRKARHVDDPEVADLLDAVEGAHGATSLALARWHGDWVPWNLARSRQGLVVWDWEYSEPGAPVGLDEVHSSYQQERILAGRSVDDALEAARHLADDAVLADLHLVMLATRYAHLTDLSGTEVGDHRAVMTVARRRTRSLRSARHRT